MTRATLKLFMTICLLLSGVTCSKSKTRVYFGSVSGVVIDGTTGAALSGATVEVTDSAENTATTGADGTYSISEVEAISQTLTASLSGYASQDQTVAISDGGTATANYALLPASYALGNIAISLNWGALPADLDANLYVPDGSPYTWIDFGSIGGPDLTSDPYAIMDQDDSNGYGPELMRVAMSGTGAYYTGGTYRYFVSNTSQEVPLTASQAVVRLFIDGDLVQTFTVPTAGAGDYWHVFDLVGSTVIPVNSIDAVLPSTP